MKILTLSLAIIFLSACSTPQHTNTLIFGTTTRFALDVSQEPTGALGVTIGYKRNEAVWMPLMANVVEDNKLVPALCGPETECNKYKGTAGTGGGAAASGATDTYSVLATFSGQTEGNASGAKAGGNVAQYFATGLAARLLAQYGGAAVVNSAAESRTSAEIKPEIIEAVTTKNKRITSIVEKLSDTTGKLDQSKLSKLLATSPAKNIEPTTLKYLSTLSSKDALSQSLLYGPERIVDSIYQTLDQI